MTDKRPALQNGMTAPQLRALTALANYGRPMSPADIGQRMDPHDGRRYPDSGQGLGRIGGTMVHRLIKKGWAVIVSYWPPTYTITSTGRDALRAHPE